METPLQLRPVFDKFGVEVVGLDVRRPLDEATKQRLREAWHKHALLAFRNQSLDEEQIDRVVEIFGRISYEGDYSSYVSNVVPDALVPEGELKFHMDFSWSPNPLRGLSLYGFEAPPEGAGGETLFANAQLAYEALPPVLKDRIKNLRIVHSTNAIDDHVVRYHSTSNHPIAYPHPVTGEIVLFCSPRHFLKIEGLGAEESRALCDELATYIKRPELVYAHAWRAGDLLVWDNLKLQHARTNFDPKYRRHLRRTQIAEPVAVPA